MVFFQLKEFDLMLFGWQDFFQNKKKNSQKRKRKPTAKPVGAKMQGCTAYIKPTLKKIDS